MNFSARTVTSVTLTVTGVSGTTTQRRARGDRGVRGSPAGGGNQPPIANAGPDQTVNQGVLVQLDGTGSFDPEAATLTYAMDPDRRAGRGAERRRHCHAQTSPRRR